MVLASEQDPDLELVSDFDEGPPVLTPIENTRTESVSSDDQRDMYHHSPLTTSKKGN